MIINIERELEKKKEYIAEYNRLESICNNRDSKKRSARDIARRMLEVIDEIEKIENLMEDKK